MYIYSKLNMFYNITSKGIIIECEKGNFMDIYNQRIAKARNLMKDTGLSLLVITPSSDLMYLTGYSKPATDRLTALLLTEHDSYFLCPAMEKNYLEEVDCQAEPILWEDSGDPFVKMVSALSAVGISKKSYIKAAVGNRMLSSSLLRLMELYPGILWSNADRVLVPLRKVKAPEEIDMIRKAQDMAERAFTRLLEHGLEGKTERQLSEQLMKLRLEEGFDAVGPGLIASGPGSASPHPVLSDNRIQAGDTVMFDFGGTYKGYHADMTRTCAVGYASDEFKEVYSIVLKAHMAVLRTAAPGTACRDMDLAGRRVIDQAGYGAFFTHRLGHGIGLDIHEPPFASAGGEGVLETRNVISNEPGIYLPGRFGIRIEDLIVITDKGCESLNTMTKELMIV